LKKKGALEHKGALKSNLGGNKMASDIGIEANSPENELKMMMIEFYHPSKTNKLSILRKLAEAYFMRKYPNHLPFLDDFFDSLFNEKHLMHRGNFGALLGNGYLANKERVRIINTAQIIVFSFLTANQGCHPKDAKLREAKLMRLQQEKQQKGRKKSDKSNR